MVFLRYMAILWLVVWLCAPASADEFYTVSGIPVDVRNRDLVAAKQQGLLEAKRRGLQALFARMAEGGAELALPQGAELEAMVAQSQIRNETYGGNRYLAEVEFQFNPKIVRRYLQRLAVPFIETQAPPVRVIPVTRMLGIDEVPGSSTVAYNAWQELLRNPENAFSLVPLVLITEDDLAHLSPNAVREEGGSSPLAGAESFIEDYIVRMEFFALQETWGQQQALAVRIVLFSRWGEPGLRATTRLRLAIGGGQVVWKPVLEWVQQQLNQHWLARLLQQVGNMSNVTRLPIVIYTAQHDESIGLRRRLAEIRAISTLQIESLTPTKVMLTIIYRGSAENFQNQLVAKDLLLRAHFPDQDGTFFETMSRQILERR
ncbi:MAG: hypothetical protein HRT36_01230 [Alphaproteobacteria bacterium]|nr:hypothetical protein [Alphaproteobacteria bacterium]